MAPPLSAAAMALRESFGDRKLPDITRKITACVACRKLKIKCRMNDDKSPCIRCKTRGLPCTVNKSIQMLLETDVAWKEVMEQRLQKLEGLIAEANVIDGYHRHKRARHGDGEDIGASMQRSPRMEQDVLCTSGIPDLLPGQPMEQAQFSHDPPETIARGKSTNVNIINLNLSCNLGAFPASSMSGILTPNASVDESACYSNYSQNPDLVSRGVIPLEVAERLFNFYQEQLDPCIHYALVGVTAIGQLPSSKLTLSTMRSRSALLTAAICTTAAFCGGASTKEYYQVCVDAFTEEISRTKTFAFHQNLRDNSISGFDDVRALCIGAFWLHGISSALSALAVRVASELNLHRCITKMPHDKEECYVRTRLYFLVYICDHQVSLSYGRPPMMRELRSLRSPRALLQSKFSQGEADLNLISQVELWSISGKVFDSFGADVEGSGFVRDRIAELERLGAEYDRWRQDWSEQVPLIIPIQQSNARDSRQTAAEDQYTRQLFFDLYFHSAKLYLYSHVFRGRKRDHLLLTSTTKSSNPVTAPTTNDGMNRFARRAVDSALSIVRSVTAKPQWAVTQRHEQQRRLSKLPFYLGTTMAFASVFLFQAASGCASQPYIFVNNNNTTTTMESSEMFRSLRQLTNLILLADSSSAPPADSIHPRHPLLSVARSLELALSVRSQSQSDGNLYTDRDVALRVEDTSLGEPFDASLGLDFFPLDEDLFGLSHLLQQGDDHHEWINPSELIDLMRSPPY